jgi:hypothetical protein
MPRMFLDDARSDHTDDPSGVATRLEGGLAHIASPEDVAPYASFVVHVFGEHLGEWKRGLQLLARIDSLPQAKSVDAAGALRRGRAALRYASGEAGAVDALDPADRAHVMCTICTNHVARNDVLAAVKALESAIEAASRKPLPEKHPAVRSLAVAGNNLSAALEEKPELSGAEREAMVFAAETGLKYWKLAGTWLQEERAEYQLARCLLRAAMVDRARQHIERCIDICKANNAPPIERFFGSAVLARIETQAGRSDNAGAAKSDALAHYAQVPADEQQWCRGVMAELESEPVRS